MLAAQPVTGERRPPTLARALSRLLAPAVSFGGPVSSPVVLAGIDDPPTPDEAPLLLAKEAAPPALVEPLPPQLLLGPLAPRRAAFGQRSEAVLELSEPVPADSQRLLLMAADGAPVGEIILHATERSAVPLRRPFAAEATETPFFPEDLADFPQIALSPPPVSGPKVRGRAAPLKAPDPGPPRPELSATYLLADLAARLASEDEALRQKLDRAG